MSLANEFRVGVTTREVAFNQDLRAIIPKTDIHGRFLAQFLKASEPVILGLTNNASHGTKRLPTELVEAIKVPVPPLPEQRRIAAILDKADAIRRKRGEGIRLVDELLRSTFLEMFGDPVSNNRSWPMIELGQLGTVTTGNTPPRDHSGYYNSEIEWIKSDNINTPYHFLTRASECLSAEGMKVGRVVPMGSVLVTCIAGSPECIGNAALADREVAFNQQINAITPREGIDPFFLYTLVLTSKRLIQLSSSVAMKGMVSKSRFESIRVIKVPCERQTEFGFLFKKLVGLSEKLDQSTKASHHLFHSLAQRAFRGEL